MCDQYEQKWIYPKRKLLICNILLNKKVDFVIINGENAADDGVGISRKNTEDFFEAGADVITSGNHIWDEKDTMDFIKNEKNTRCFFKKYEYTNS